MISLKDSLCPTCLVARTLIHHLYDHHWYIFIHMPLYSSLTTYYHIVPLTRHYHHILQIWPPVLDCIIPVWCESILDSLLRLHLGLSVVLIESWFKKCYSLIQIFYLCFRDCLFMLVPPQLVLWLLSSIVIQDDLLPSVPVVDSWGVEVDVEDDVLRCWWWWWCFLWTPWFGESLFLDGLVEFENPCCLSQFLLLASCPIVSGPPYFLEVHRIACSSKWFQLLL